MSRFAVARNAALECSWWELNGFEDWDVRLVVTCRQEHMRDYGQCLGDPWELYLQRFGEQQIETYLRMRLRLHDAQRPAPADRPASDRALPSAVTDPVTSTGDGPEACGDADRSVCHAAPSRTALCTRTCPCQGPNGPWAGPHERVQETKHPPHVPHVQAPCPQR